MLWNVVQMHFLDLQQIDSSLYSMHWTTGLQYLYRLRMHVQVIRIIGYVPRAVILYIVAAMLIFCTATELATMSGTSSAPILVDSDSSLDSDHELEGDCNTALTGAKSLLKVICSKRYR